MGKNYFNQFKVGKLQSFNPMTVFSKDPTGVTNVFLHPDTNMPHVNPLGDISGDIGESIFGKSQANFGGGIGDTLCKWTGLCPSGKPKGPSMNPHAQASVVNADKMFKMLQQKLKDFVGVAGVSDLANATGISEDLINKLLSATGQTTNVMRAVADVAQVVGTMIEAAAGGPIDIFGDFAAEQIMQGSSTLTSVADLIDNSKALVESGGKALKHFENGDYHLVLAELGTMGGQLTDIVGEEAAEKLKLAEFQKAMTDASGKAKTAKEEAIKFRTKAESFFGVTAEELLGLEKSEVAEAEELKAQAQELDDIKALEIADTKTIEKGQQKLERGQHQIEAQQRRTMAELGVLEHGQLLNRELQKEQIQSSRTNTQMLKDIAGENRHETQAIKHKQVILDSELQKLDNEEIKEVDASMRMATKIDPPRTTFDFVKDLDDFETNSHRIDYIAENYDTFIRLPQNEIDQLLSKMIDMGAIASF